MQMNAASVCTSATLNMTEKILARQCKLSYREVYTFVVSSMHVKTTRLVICNFCVDTSWMLTSDSCGGFRQSTYDRSVRYAVSLSDVWDKSKITLVLLDITGHLLMKDEKYLKITIIGQVSAYITDSVTGPVMCGEARLVISSGFVIRRQPMLTSMLLTSMSIEFSTAVLPAISPVLSALKTDLT